MAYQTIYPWTAHICQEHRRSTAKGFDDESHSSHSAENPKYWLCAYSSGKHRESSVDHRILRLPLFVHHEWLECIAIIYANKKKIQKLNMYKYIYLRPYRTKCMRGIISAQLRSSTSRKQKIYSAPILLFIVTQAKIRQFFEHLILLIQPKSTHFNNTRSGMHAEFWLEKEGFLFPSECTLKRIKHKSAECTIHKQNRREYHLTLGIVARTSIYFLFFQDYIGHSSFERRIFAIQWLDDIQLQGKVGGMNNYMCEEETWIA